MKTYFISGGGMTKVGISHDPRQRIRSLQRLVPVDLRMTYTAEGGRELEAALHRILTRRGKHVFREWFEEIDAGEAKALVREAKRVAQDSTPDGFRRLTDLARRKLELGDLDGCAAVLERLDASAGPKMEVEALHAELFAARLGFEPAPVPRPHGGYSLPDEPPAVGEPDPADAYEALLDL